MEQVISSERLPIKLWLEDLEEGALQQAKNLANLPFAFKHIAIMPDSHQGYGMPIGGVLATEDAIIPNAVGVDIGCGMCSLRTDRKEIDRDDLKSIMSIIRKTVPVGFNHHDQQQDEKWMPELNGNLEIVEQEYESAQSQVGTLGGGNHFIEIQKGSDGYVWIMIHSGSRNIGYTVAKHYNQKAKELNEKWKSETRTDLAFFPRDTKEFDDYIREMDYCIEFALNNRKLMMERVQNAITDVLGEVDFSDFINKPHNFASLENHFGKNLLIHRKGATRAREGELGMIPGSQGSSSFIVRGKGNRDAFESCSHGAGRVMSRNQAKKTLSVEEESKPLEERGILHAIRHKSDLDEAPGSYKDIQKVMELQKDLIEIVIELEPLAVVKG
ncbi:RtcB family protein [Rhodohalobacter sulfatireducens]|uniref:3'-phosphate/5'-hydroxy nucleic acid ligase n=1 Tax=Rhodohalobacter sulfatireducens TaxID=2911366 RepID=A0ABS9KG74_9BACT|nr:RtcB family protein [Rhodohalobacter sulfatireducens]MCG2589843.1 RtcB family protein [Rhodohalobacter sulfatireducens]